MYGLGSIWFAPAWNKKNMLICGFGPRFFDSSCLGTLHWIRKQPATGGGRKLVELERSAV